MEYLFALYEKLTAPLLPVAPKTKSRATGSTLPRKQKTPGLYSQKLKPLPEVESTAESEADDAVFHNIIGKDDSLPYRVE